MSLCCAVRGTTPVSAERRVRFADSTGPTPTYPLALCAVRRLPFSVPNLNVALDDQCFLRPGREDSKIRCRSVHQMRHKPGLAMARPERRTVEEQRLRDSTFKAQRSAAKLHPSLGTDLTRDSIRFRILALEVALARVLRYAP